MTLTEEQRGTVAFNLEKARAMICHYRIENPGDADTDCGLGDLVRQANLAEEALDEIERLRASLVEHEEHEKQTHEVLGNILGTDDTLENVAKRAAASIKELEAEIERLRASLIDLHAEYINTLEKNPDCSAWDLDEQSDADQRRLRRNAAHAISITEPPIYLQAEQLAARIKELEDALVENLAADIAYDDRLLWSRLDGQRQDEYREKARQQLQAGGKIGTGARPPCWQITEDRVTAIDQGLRFLEWSNAKNGSVETKKHIATLQTMLEETGDKNGFEGRNKMRIETIR